MKYLCAWYHKKQVVCVLIVTILLYNLLLHITFIKSMKCESSVSTNSSMSAEGCSIKLRFFILVVNTANLINERATPTLGISHALAAPVAFFTTYLFIGILVLGSLHKRRASTFLQIYALLACCSIQSTLSFIVFKELKQCSVGKKHAALVLDGVLPMINAVLFLVDLTGIIFSNRQEISPPSTLPATTTSSRSEIVQ